MEAKYKSVTGWGTLVLVLDQASKLWIQNTFSFWDSIQVIPGMFKLVYVLNRGAAFGFLNNTSGTWQTYFFIAVTALAVVLIFHLVRSVNRRDPFLFNGLGLVLGGAVGNLVDRIRLGHVIDFLDFYWGRYHWPAFNIADVAISIGVLCLIISFYIRKKNASNTP